MRTTLLSLCCLLVGLIRAGAESIPLEKHVYKKVGERELTLLLAKPTNWQAGDRRPAIVFFHGGGWIGGNATSFDQHCRYFASRGLVTATVEYRLLNKTNKESPLACVQDARSALRWMRSHAAEFGIDPQRIAAAGGSAGGHLAAFCGLVEGKDDPQDDLKISPKPQALILFNPVLNNGPGQWGYPRVGEAYKEFSPAHNVTPQAPPTVIFLGSNDHLIPVELMQRFQSDMQKAGVRCDLHVYEGQKHGFYGKGNPRAMYETVTEADKFLASLGWLKGPPTFPKPTARAKKK